MVQAVRRIIIVFPRSGSTSPAATRVQQQRLPQAHRPVGRLALAVVVVEEAGQGDDQRQLHELGRLHAAGPEGDPARLALRPVADELERHQRRARSPRRWARPSAG
jgi:hypothetical protein